MSSTRPEESNVRYSQHGAFDTSDWGRMVTGANMGTIYLTDEELVCGFGSESSMLRHAADKLLFGLPSGVGLVHSSNVDLEEARARDETVAVPLPDVTTIELEDWTAEGRKIVVDARDHPETPVYITAGRASGTPDTRGKPSGWRRRSATPPPTRGTR